MKNRYILAILSVIMIGEQPADSGKDDLLVSIGPGDDLMNVTAFARKHGEKVGGLISDGFTATAERASIGELQALVVNRALFCSGMNVSTTFCQALTPPSLGIFTEKYPSKRVKELLTIMYATQTGVTRGGGSDGGPRKVWMQLLQHPDASGELCKIVLAYTYKKLGDAWLASARHAAARYKKALDDGAQREAAARPERAKARWLNHALAWTVGWHDCLSKMSIEDILESNGNREETKTWRANACDDAFIAAVAEYDVLDIKADSDAN